MTTIEKVKDLLEKLVGEKVCIDATRFNNLTIFDHGVSLGYSQFNEVLLLLGFDRVTRSFFQYLVDRTIEWKADAIISSVEQLERGVDEFSKLALLLYANIKYGFKNLARDANELKYHLETIAPESEEHFRSRHAPILEIEPITADEAYLLGYKVQDRITSGIETAFNNQTQKREFYYPKSPQKSDCLFSI